MEMVLKGEEKRLLWKLSNTPWRLSIPRNVDRPSVCIT